MAGPALPAVALAATCFVLFSCGPMAACKEGGLTIQFAPGPPQGVPPPRVTASAEDVLGPRFLDGLCFSFSFGDFMDGNLKKAQENVANCSDCVAQERLLAGVPATFFERGKDHAPASSKEARE